MEKIYKIITFLLVIYFSSVNAQNEFYINGATVYVNSRTSTSIPTLYVKGEIKNINGSFSNAAGLIEITGNWTNTVSTNHYVSTGMERFTGTTDQQINGTWNGTSSNQDQFYDLKLNKTSSSGELLLLNADVNINANGSVEFESTNGIIRTQLSSIGTSDATSSGNYSNILYLRNPDPSKLIGNSTGSGATTKYVEGKFKRQVDRIGTYFFPIGVNKNYLGGMNATEVTFNTAPGSTGLLGYIQPGVSTLTHSDVFCDVAKISPPLIGGTPSSFSTCTGPPDGFDDIADLNTYISHEWIMTPDAGSSFNYDIIVYPSSVLDATATYTDISSCGGPYSKVKYLSNNGIPGGTNAVAGTYIYLLSAINGYFICPTDNTLSSQTSFSTFRLYGASDPYTILPIELLYLTAKPVDNSYIQLDWATASEKNNKGFEIQKSIDAQNFITIGWQDGHGNSSQVNTYGYNDYQVEKDLYYYYRLKQFDFSGSFTYSPIVKAKLLMSKEFNVGNLIPNPSFDYSSLNVETAESGIARLSITNILGQQLLDKEISLNIGINKIDIDATQFAAATYMVNLEFKDKKAVRKLVKD